MKAQNSRPYAKNHRQKRRWHRLLGSLSNCTHNTYCAQCMWLLLCTSTQATWFHLQITSAVCTV